jgi:hypothetical protein
MEDSRLNRGRLLPLELKVVASLYIVGTRCGDNIVKACILRLGTVAAGSHLALDIKDSPSARDLQYLPKILSDA